MHLAARIDDILEYWLGPLRSDDVDASEHGPVKAKWFGGGKPVDDEIRARFGDDHERAARGELVSWESDPKGALALVVLLDQFSRNLHRGSGKTFETDDAALRVAEQGVATGADRSLALFERSFFYMPFMHSESPAVHDRGRKKFEELAADARVRAPKNAAYFESILGFEDKHRVIVDRFGRYPHRNAMLGRVSTPEEIEFLKQPGSSF